MARISYLAVLSEDPASLAGFYAPYFGFTELGRTADGDVTLSDGGFNLTLFRHRPGLGEPRMEPGLHHLGIAVDNIDDTVARYLAHYPRGTVIKESGELSRGEVRIHDPECNPVSLSARNFGIAPGPPRVPRIAHIALNALEAMEHEGTLTVSTLMRGREIEVEFADTGRGIAGDIQDRMFEPFVTGKEAGTGLGLSIAHRIIASYGGRIEARNIPEGGAAFTVILPLRSTV